MIPDEFLISIDELYDSDLSNAGEVLFRNWLLAMKTNGDILNAFKIRESKQLGVKRPDFLVLTEKGYAVVELKERISNNALQRAYDETPDDELANVTTALEDLNLRDSISSSEVQHKALSEEFDLEDDYERWTILNIYSGLPSSLAMTRTLSLESEEWSEESFDSMDHEACVLLYGKHAYRPVGFINGRVDAQHFIKRDGYFAPHRESCLDYVGILGKLSGGIPHVRFYPQPRPEEELQTMPLDFNPSDRVSLFDR